MNWWIYKCNGKNKSHQFAYGDWRDFFNNAQGDDTWGDTKTIPKLGQLKKGDMIIAYQTDRNELVGTCRMLGFTPQGSGKVIHFEPIEEIGRKVLPLKKGDHRIANIPALKPGPIKTLYEISTSDAIHLLKAAGASNFASDRAASTSPDVQSEKVRVEGEKRTIEATVRDAQLRVDAKAKWGLKCYCCGFEFAHFYGAIASKLAIVHHLKMFKGKRRKVTVQDVRIVCANCHQVIHVAKEPIDVDVLKARISKCWTPWSDDGISSKG